MGTSMFMWEWQHVWRASIHHLTKSVLEVLRLRPSATVFVLGIPSRDEDERGVYFEPESIDLTPSQFAAVRDLAWKRYESDPDKDVIITAPHLQKAHQETLWPKAIHEATLEILHDLDTRRNTVSLASFPVLLNEHLVQAVIQVDADLVASQYSLTSTEQVTQTGRTRRLEISFLDAALRTILAEARRELQLPTRGNSLGFAHPDRVLEDAATSLLASVAARVNNFGPVPNFLSLANAISAERYEGESGNGTLILTGRDQPSVQAIVKLRQPIEASDYRALRKLLEVSGPGASLLCDGLSVWGMGSVAPDYDHKRENLFELNFTDHYIWELRHAGNVMLRVRYRTPELPRERYDVTQVHDHAERLFGKPDTEAIIRAVEAAVTQKHGTILVITPDAAREADRLSGQGSPIEPIPVAEGIIKRLSSVDGAILMSPDASIQAFGVILDGIATNNGSPARGARYNSAVRYVDAQAVDDVNCLALIVSEDGYVDLYPKLRPRIPRAIVDDLLAELDDLADPSRQFNEDRAYAALSNLNRVRFYLLAADIEWANAAKNAVHDRLKAHRMAEGRSVGFILPVYSDFEADPEMNETYYLPAER